MDQNELETYQVQLSQVEQAIAADPDNEELISLASELKELIELTKQANTGPSAPTTAGSSSSKPEAPRKPSQTNVPSTGRCGQRATSALPSMLEMVTGILQRFRASEVRRTIRCTALSSKVTTLRS